MKITLISIRIFSKEPFFLEDKITVLEWPAADLNPIENIWEFLTRWAHYIGKQYLTVRVEKTFNGNLVKL